MEPQNPVPENQNEETQQPAQPEPAAAPAPIKTEDDLFQSANSDMELEQAPPPQPITEKKSRKKLIIVPIVIALIVAGGAAAWYFLMSDSGDQQTTTQPEAPTQTEEVELTYEPNTVAYAYKATSNDPVSLYTRPAAGGERKEIQKLTRDAAIVDSDTQGANVAFVDDSVIYASTDHGATYKKVFEGAAGEQITSLIIDGDGTGLAFASLKSGAKKNEVTSMDFNGENQKTLFTATEQGVTLHGWSSKNQRVVYQSYARLNSDGITFTPYVYDLKKDKQTRILDDVDPDTIASMASSPDTSLVIYVVGVVDTAAEGIGPALKAPYNVSVLTVKDNKSTAVTTVGKSGEKNPNGTTMYRNFMTGFATGTNTPYFVEDNQLSLVRNNEALNFYESDKDILDVLYVSDDYVIASSGDYNDFALTNYDVNTKKSVNILSGDASTTLFGVTTD